MNVSTWSIRKPVPAWPIVVLLASLGLIGLLLPGMDLQTIQISATLQGAVPSRFELDVGRRIEDHLVVLNRLDHIATLITDGSVSISASFARDKNGAQALSEVRSAVDSVCADQPSGMASATAGSASMSYRIQSVVLGTLTSRNATRPGIVRGDCQLAASERA